MQCRDFREVADSYLSDELLVETNHDVIAHLEACAGCRRELAARRELRATLRASFTKAQELRIRDEFENQLRTKLHTAAITGMKWRAMGRRAWLAIAASLLLIAAFGLLALWQRQRAQTPSPIAAGEHRDTNTGDVKPADAPPRSAETSVDPNLVLAKMSELAAGDHRDCAIGHRLPERPIDLDEAGRKYDRVYLDLVKAVRSHLADSIELIELVTAHACRFKGRWFAHIVVRHRGRLASLLVTQLDKPNGVTAREKPTEFDQHGHVIACSTAEGYRVSCFQTARHAVFVVSDLDEGQNLALARTLAPPVYKHVSQMEDVT